jgi:hypothetical protein
MMADYEVCKLYPEDRNMSVLPYTETRAKIRPSKTVSNIRYAKVD